MGPPNTLEGGPPVWAAFFAFAWGLPLLLFRFFRKILVTLKGDPNRGRFYAPPPLPRFVPAPPPPSTPMLPRAPVGGTGETRRVETGRLRSSLPLDAGGALIFPFPPNPSPTVSMFRGKPVELPPEYPDEDDETPPPTDSTGAR